MATSGSFSSNAYNGRYLTFEWTRTNYSIEENWSEISWTLKGGGSAPSSWYYAGPFWVWFGDDLIWSSESRIQLYDGTVVASGTKRLWHYSDGTYSFHPWIRGAIYNTACNVEAHQVYDLDTIPRISTFTLSAGSVEMGSNQKVSIQTASPSFTHKLWYRVGSSAWTVIADNIGNVYNWTVPIDFANYIPNNTSCTVELSVETFNGSANLGETRATFTATVPASVVPSITSIEISDPTSLADTYGGYVQTKSKVKIQVSASGAYSSSIRSIRINDGIGTVSNSNPYTSNVISVSGGSKTVTVTVTDSRERTVTRTASFTVLSYETPVISQLSASRCTNNGTSDDGGEYMKISFSASITPLNNKNGKSFTVQYKKQTDSSWSTAGTKTDAYSWSSSIVVSANTEYTYDVRIVVSDNFSTNTYSTNVSTAFTLVDFNKSGKGMAVGKVSEKDAFECALPAEFNSVKTNNGASLSEMYSMSDSFLVHHAAGATISINDLISRSTPTFFTNWHDQSFFNALYGSGIIIPGLDSNNKFVIYTSIQGRLQIAFSNYNGWNGWRDAVLTDDGVNCVSFLRGYSQYLELNWNNTLMGITWWKSDTKLKDNIKPTEKTALDKVEQIDFIQFDWKNGDGHVDLGVSANQLEEIMPDAVYEIEQPEESEYDSIKNIDTGKMTTYALKAIQELKAEVDSLKEEIKKLKGTD